MFLEIDGKIKSGFKRGRRLGFPTINIPVSQSIKKDQWGIYFSLIKVGDVYYPGVTHLGPPKTFAVSYATCETFLLTLKRDLYGQKVKKKLILRFRDVEKFNSTKALKKQIKHDIKLAKKFFGL
ncbi:MAG: riboflavin kinase [Patescibacteria group bacterium]|nr:riboflavin kinase [Patescibacteria group bacterium]